MESTKMLNVLLLISLSGIFQVLAQNYHSRDGAVRNSTVVPTNMVQPLDTHDAHMKTSLNFDIRSDDNSTMITHDFNSSEPHKHDTIQTTPINSNLKSIANTQSTEYSPRMDDLKLPKEQIRRNSRGPLEHENTLRTPIQSEIELVTHPTSFEGATSIDDNSKSEDGYYNNTENGDKQLYSTIDNETNSENINYRQPKKPKNGGDHISNFHMRPTYAPNYTHKQEDLLKNNENGNLHHPHSQLEISERPKRLETSEKPERLENSEKPERQESSTQYPTSHNLCSFCQCDPKNLDVYCRHRHHDEEQLHHLKLDSQLIPKTALTLHIQDYDTVTITNGTFSSHDLELRNIKFENIKNMVLVTNSLYFNAKARSNRVVAVEFVQCNIEEMPMETLTQNSRSHDQKSDIDLEDTRFLSLYILRSNITAIRSYALHQARILYFKMLQSKVDEIEEHGFHVDIYEDWAIENSLLPMLAKHAICLRAQKIVIFSKNIFKGLHNRSLEINSTNQVLFEYNRVAFLGAEALLGIVPTERGSSFVFLNNTVSDPRNQSLILNKNYPFHERTVLDNKFNILCDCDVQERLQSLMNISQYSDHDDNQTFTAVKESSHCKESVNIYSYTKIETYLSDNCSPIPIPIIASAATVIIVIVITIVVCIVCSKRAAKAKEEANYLGECCYSHSFSTLNSGNQTVTTPAFSSEFASWERGNNLQPWVVAVPEVKTYQETEVNVQYEHTDPLNASVRGSYHDPMIDSQRKTQVRKSCPFN